MDGFPWLNDTHGSYVAVDCLRSRSGDVRPDTRNGVSAPELLNEFERLPVLRCCPAMDEPAMNCTHGSWFRLSFSSLLVHPPLSSPEPSGTLGRDETTVAHLLLLAYLDMLVVVVEGIQWKRSDILVDKLLQMGNFRSRFNHTIRLYCYVVMHSLSCLIVIR